MALQFNRAGKERLLKNLVNNVTTTSALTMKLYKGTAVVPVYALTQTPASFTECTETGYSSQAMTGATWVVANPNATEIAKATFGADPGTAFEFTFTGDMSSTPVYGYYIVNAAGDLLGAELFNGSTGYTLGSSGGKIRVTLSLSLT